MKTDRAMAILASVALIATACAGGEGASGDPESATPAGDAETAAEGGDTPADTTATTDDPIQVGALLALGGVYAGQGIPSRQGIELAIEQVNEDGGVNGRQVEIQVEDTAGEPQQAVSLVSQFASDEGIVALLGPSTSAEAPASAPVANQEEIPLVATTAISDAMLNSGPWGFRMRVPPATTAGFIAEAVIETNGLENVTVVYPQDNEGSAALAELGAAQFEDRGATTETLTVQSSDTDFSSVITRLQGQNPDAVYCPCPIPVAAGFFAQARDAGVSDDVQFIGEFYHISEQFVEIAGEAADGIVFPSDYSPDANFELNQQFVSDYQAAYDELPDSQSAAGFSAANFLIEGLKRVDGEITRDSLLAALESVEEMPTVLGQGTWRMNDERVADLDLLLVRLQEGEFVPVT